MSHSATSVSFLKGDLDKYPKCERPFNLSLIPGCDKCKKDKRYHHGDKK